MPRGQLILIEGLDRSGKSTQASILASKFSQNKLIKFPNRSTAIGKIINEYLTNTAFQLNDQSTHLLFSANRWELNREMQDLLNLGYFVVLDRYIYSGIAYTLAKNDIDDSRISSSSGGGENTNLADIDWLLGPDKGLPKPDLTLFLTLSMEEISKRKGWGEERYELQQFQNKVKQCFLKVLNNTEDPSIEIVDVGANSIDQVSNQIWDIVVSHGANVLVDKPIAFIT
ncbi:CDC8 [Candida oxycetoniae]|uniref:Thymidylate kinase n=1 Tax=Candida oxycetoniae TaxID=497107 RepID=A0AAI9T1Z1_9ASCO|nr:CDC8 [Candida oxycetoniae]KAI3407128.2 CDC8 [Candida oxycetoniae]